MYIHGVQTATSGRSADPTVANPNGAAGVRPTPRGQSGATKREPGFFLFFFLGPVATHVPKSYFFPRLFVASKGPPPRYISKPIGLLVVSNFESVLRYAYNGS